MNHQAKKRFGQNFLRDKNLLLKIVRESNIENLHVIEVGPGQGALTSFLADKAIKVIAYEIDQSLKPTLDILEEAYQNLTIIYQDFLETDLSFLETDYHVVANVPYYITTPILFKILETISIKTASLMIQKEVCDRLLAQPNSKQYNALTVILNYHAQAFKMMDVKRHMFFPVPNVDSAVIRIIKRDKPLLSKDKEELFISLVKASFKQKRKTIINNLHEAFSIPKDQLEDILHKSDIDPQSRAEALTINQFLTLTEVWAHD